MSAHRHLFDLPAMTLAVGDTIDGSLEHCQACADGCSPHFLPPTHRMFRRTSSPAPHDCILDITFSVGYYYTARSSNVANVGGSFLVFMPGYLSDQTSTRRCDALVNARGDPHRRATGRSGRPPLGTVEQRPFAKVRRLAVIGSPQFATRLSGTLPATVRGKRLHCGAVRVRKSDWLAERWSHAKHHDDQVSGTQRRRASTTGTP